MIVKYIVLLFAAASIVGCETPTKQQLENMFPPSTTLSLELKKDKGITGFYVYHVSEIQPIQQLRDYPIVNEERKQKVAWHEPTTDEIRDFKKFVREEQSDKIAIRIAERISNGDYLLALVYNKGRGHLGSKAYSVYDWQDIYILNTVENKLIFIQYGRF